MTLAQKLEHEFDERLVRGFGLAKLSAQISLSSLYARQLEQSYVHALASNSIVVHLLAEMSNSKFRRCSLLKVCLLHPQSKIGSTEELDDVLVRQAHNEALIEFEYQRREEAEVFEGVSHRA